MPMRTYDLMGGVGKTSAASGPVPGSGIAKFWKLRGQRVFESGGVLWGHYRKSIYISLPFHLLLDPEAAETKLQPRDIRLHGIGRRRGELRGAIANLQVCRLGKEWHKDRAEQNDARNVARGAHTSGGAGRPTRRKARPTPSSALGLRSCEKVAAANCSGDLRSPLLLIPRTGGQRPPLQSPG